jgi:hypothetical protein
MKEMSMPMQDHGGHLYMQTNEVRNCIIQTLPEMCACEQETVNLLQNTPRAHSPTLVNYSIQT